MKNRDLLLSANHDLSVMNFDLALTSDEQVVAQRVKQKLSLFKGEWFLDIEAGIPYYQSILGQKNSNDAIRAVFINEIRQVEGVVDLTSFSLDLDAVTRSLNIKFTIIDDLNNEISMEL